MALLFMDSFDHYVTADLSEKWTTLAGAPTIVSGTGRHSSAALHCAALQSVLRGLPASGATAIMGVAYKPGTLQNRFAGFSDGTQSRDQFYLRWNTDGSLGAYRGAAFNGMAGTQIGTLLASSAAGVVSANTYVYLEIKVVLHDTTGSVTVRVNGAPVITAINQDTANGSVVWTAAWLGAVDNQASDFDDLYVLDGTGAAPWNDFLGDCRVDAGYPTAAGATTGWTSSAGANWQCVDDTAPNDDTDYTAAAAAGLTDTFIVQDAPVAGATILGVQHCLSAKKTDVGAASIAPVIRHSGVDYVGANLTPGTAYAVLQQINQTNPGTAAAWTEAGFNAAEFGYKRTA